MVVKVLNYAKYQELENYKNDTTHDKPDDLHTKHTRNTNDTINNNGNNEKNDKNVRTHKHKGFQKPTTKQVSDYCKERNNDVDAQTFIDHYESNGWKVGRNSMKDWRAAVRTWERNEYGGQSLKEGNKIKIINPKKPS